MITWRLIFRIQIKGKWFFQRSPFQTQFPVLSSANPLEVFPKRALAWFLTHFFLPTCSLPFPPSRPLLPALPEVLLFRFWTLSLQKFTGISICCAFRSASLTATRPHKLNRLHPFPSCLRKWSNSRIPGLMDWLISSQLKPRYRFYETVLWQAEVALNKTKSSLGSQK